MAMLMASSTLTTAYASDNDLQRAIAARTAPTTPTKEGDETSSKEITPAKEEDFSSMSYESLVRDLFEEVENGDDAPDNLKEALCENYKKYASSSAVLENAFLENLADRLANTASPISAVPTRVMRSAVPDQRPDAPARPDEDDAKSDGITSTERAAAQAAFSKAYQDIISDNSMRKGPRSADELSTQIDGLDQLIQTGKNKGVGKNYINQAEEKMSELETELFAATKKERGPKAAEKIQAMARGVATRRALVDAYKEALAAFGAE